MIRISTYISSLVERGFRRIKVLINGRSDVQPTYQAMPFGMDGVPPDGTRAIYADTGEKGRNLLLGYINTTQLAALQSGENYIYSTDTSGSLAAFMKLNNDSTIDILGTGDFLVRYNELEIGFNQLRTDLNALITAYNAHVHITTATVGPSAVPGVLSPTVSQATASTADISAAQITELRTP